MVYVLDDKADDQVSLLAKKFKFKYLSRPNRGELAKAGNLKYGFENSSGDFIVVLDADFEPHSDLIADLLPYMEDKVIGIVQSPQYFSMNKRTYQRSIIEYAAGYVQQDFYRLTQRARDHFGGAICVGTNALYRRSALEQVGGFAQVGHSEDVFTGLKIVNGGYTIKYVPLVLARGLNPSNLESYFRQHNRWCTGSIKLLLSEQFRKAPVSIFHKLCYFSGSLFYLTTSLSLVLSLQICILLLFHIEAVNIENALPFIPYLILSRVLLPASQLYKRKPGITLVTTAQMYTYFYAIVRLIFSEPIKWTPTGNSKENISEGFSDIIKIATINVGLYWGVFLYLLFMQNLAFDDYKLYLVLFWFFYYLINHNVFLITATLEKLKRAG